MNDSNAERSLRKYKGFENAVKQMLTQEYKFLGGEKIQEMFIKDLLVELNRHLKDGWKLDAGQVVWLAAHKDEYPGRNKTIENTRVVKDYTVGIKYVRYICYPTRDSNGEKRAKA